METILAYPIRWKRGENTLRLNTMEQVTDQDFLSLAERLLQFEAVNKMASVSRLDSILLVDGDVVDTTVGIPLPAGGLFNPDSLTVQVRVRNQGKFESGRWLYSALLHELAHALDHTFGITEEERWEETLNLFLSSAKTLYLAKETNPLLLALLSCWTKPLAQAESKEGAIKEFFAYSVSYMCVPALSGLIDALTAGQATVCLNEFHPLLNRKEILEEAEQAKGLNMVEDVFDMILKPYCAQ